MLRVKKLSPFAVVPRKLTEESAGFDLYSANSYRIPAKGKKLCWTDIQIGLPDETYGRIAPRSGLERNTATE